MPLLYTVSRHNIVTCVLCLPPFKKVNHQNRPTVHFWDQTVMILFLQRFMLPLDLIQSVNYISYKKQEMGKDICIMHVCNYRMQINNNRVITVIYCGSALLIELNVMNAKEIHRGDKNHTPLIVIWFCFRVKLQKNFCFPRLSL